jgi:hypothetical protein
MAKKNTDPKNSDNRGVFLEDGFKALKREKGKKS